MSNGGFSWNRKSTSAKATAVLIKIHFDQRHTGQSKPPEMSVYLMVIRF